MIKILFIGSNTKICAPNSTHLIENLPDEVLERYGFKRYCIGPGFYIPKDIEDAYSYMDGKPDFIIRTGSWKFYADVHSNWLKTTYNVTDDENKRMWDLECELMSHNLGAVHWEDYYRALGFQEFDKIIFSSYYYGNLVKPIQEKSNGRKLYLIPFSVDLDLINTNIKKPKVYNAFVPGSVFAHVYPYRVAAVHYILKNHISTPLFSRVWNERPKGDRYFNLLNLSRILITCGSIYKLPAKKIFELLASTAMPIFDIGIETLDLHGIRDGVHARICGIDELPKMLKYYIAHRTEAETIAVAGRDYFLKELTPEKMAARYLFPAIREIVG